MGDFTEYYFLLWFLKKLKKSAKQESSKLYMDTFYELLSIIGDYMILTPTLKAQSLIGKMMAIGWL